MQTAKEALSKLENAVSIFLRNFNKCSMMKLRNWSIWFYDCVFFSANTLFENRSIWTQRLVNRDSKAFGLIEPICSFVQPYVFAVATCEKKESSFVPKKAVNKVLLAFEYVEKSLETTSEKKNKK